MCNKLSPNVNLSTVYYIESNNTWVSINDLKWRVSKCPGCADLPERKLFLSLQEKYPAYRRHWISWRLRIVAQIQYNQKKLQQQQKLRKRKKNQVSCVICQVSGVSGHVSCDAGKILWKKIIWANSTIKTIFMFFLNFLPSWIFLILFALLDSPPLHISLCYVLTSGNLAAQENQHLKVCWAALLSKLNMWQNTRLNKTER